MLSCVMVRLPFDTPIEASSSVVKYLQELGFQLVGAISCKCSNGLKIWSSQGFVLFESVVSIRSFHNADKIHSHFLYDKMVI